MTTQALIAELRSVADDLETRAEAQRDLLRDAAARLEELEEQLLAEREDRSLEDQRRHWWLSKKAEAQR